MTTQTINIQKLNVTSKKVLYSTKNKKLTMITRIEHCVWYTYFELKHDNEIVGFSEDLLELINQYNKIDP